MSPRTKDTILEVLLILFTVGCRAVWLLIGVAAVAAAAALIVHFLAVADVVDVRLCISLPGGCIPKGPQQ